MKLYVLSDTHGSIEKAVEVYEELHSVDLIIHLGDLVTDANGISKITGMPVISIKGNNDYSSKNEDFRIIETECGNIFLTHGHHFSVKTGLQRLLYRTLETGCNAVLFGHTHMPLFTEANGVYLLNPGSLTIPADGSSGSYALVNTSAAGFFADILF